MATVDALMTTEELLALPDDGVERWLIAGELRERPMTRRNRFHSKTMALITGELVTWWRNQAQSRGEVLTGDAGVRLQIDPDTTVGVDVTYISPEVLSRQSGTRTVIEGPPMLAIEILSPTDVNEDTQEKVRSYLDAGTSLVWIVDPVFRTVIVHQPDREPELFNVRQEISAEPHLPGFRVPVIRLFE